MLVLTGNEIVCPSGTPGGQASIINLKEIANIESRIQDVRIANPGNAAELLSCFNIAWLDLAKQIVFLRKEKNDALRHADRVRARIILDEVPNELKKKGLLSTRSPAGSEDLRQAVLALDPVHQDALERVDAITAVIELLQCKATAFDMAYTSVKKILSGDTQGNFLAKISPEPKGYNGFGVPR